MQGGQRRNHRRFFFDSETAVVSIAGVSSRRYAEGRITGSTTAMTRIVKWAGIVLAVAAAVAGVIVIADWLFLDGLNLHGF